MAVHRRRASSSSCASFLPQISVSRPLHHTLHTQPLTQCSIAQDAWPDLGHRGSAGPLLRSRRVGFGRLDDAHKQEGNNRRVFTFSYAIACQVHLPRYSVEPATMARCRLGPWQQPCRAGGGGDALVVAALAVVNELEKGARTKEGAPSLLPSHDAHATTTQRTHAPLHTHKTQMHSKDNKQATYLSRWTPGTPWCTRPSWPSKPSASTRWSTT